MPTYYTLIHTGRQHAGSDKYPFTVSEPQAALIREAKQPHDNCPNGKGGIQAGPPIRLYTVGMRPAFWLLLLIITCTGFGCGSGAGAEQKAITGHSSEDANAPDTEEGARTVLAEFLKPGADCRALSQQLRPAKDDYSAVFESAFASKAEAAYTPAWEGGQMVIAPNSGQTELLLSHAATEELKNPASAALEAFPGGYKKVASEFKDGLTIYRFKFVEPGKTLGMAYDGLINVNGHWRIFPKPWRILR